MAAMTTKTCAGPTLRRLAQLDPTWPPSHPGAILVNEFLTGGQSRIPGVGPQTLLDLVLGDGKITPRLAGALAREFGTSAEFWLNLRRNYDNFPWKR